MHNAQLKMTTQSLIIHSLCIVHCELCIGKLLFIKIVRCEASQRTYFIPVLYYNSLLTAASTAAVATAGAVSA